MSWWFRARRAHTILPSALLIMTALLLVMQDNTVELPSFLTFANNPVLLVLLAPLPVCSAILLCLETRLTAAEASAVRPVHFWDAGLVITFIALSCFCGLLVSESTASNSAASVGRNIAFLTGLMLIGRSRLGQTAAMIPVVWVFVVTFIGSNRNHEPHPWAVLPAVAGDVTAAAAACVSLLIGLSVQLTGRHPQSH